MPLPYPAIALNFEPFCALPIPQPITYRVYAQLTQLPINDVFYNKFLTKPHLTQYVHALEYLLVVVFFSFFVLLCPVTIMLYHLLFSLYVVLFTDTVPQFWFVSDYQVRFVSNCQVVLHVWCFCLFLTVFYLRPPAFYYFIIRP